MVNQVRNQQERSGWNRDVAAECAQLAPLLQPQLPDYKRLSPEALPFAIIVRAVRKRK